MPVIVTNENRPHNYETLDGQLPIRGSMRHNSCERVINVGKQALCIIALGVVIYHPNCQ